MVSTWMGGVQVHFNKMTGVLEMEASDGSTVHVHNATAPYT